MLNLSLLIPSLVLAGCVVDGAQADPSETSQASQASTVDPCPANVPPALAPAATADLAFAMNAQGVQRYACVQSTTGYAWTFVAPDAELFTDDDTHLAIHHLAGPTWLAKDSSSVVAAKAAGATVDPTAIPWLLLNVSSHGGADGRLTDIAQIQRLSTTGGNAPATGCDADHVGMQADVLYTARYFFYRTDNRANRTRCGG